MPLYLGEGVAEDLIRFKHQQRNSTMKLFWPKMFETNIVSLNKDECLSDQLVAWGNIYLGIDEPPENFYEMMEAASHVTGAFTATECRDAADKLIWERKKKEYAECI